MLFSANCADDVGARAESFLGRFNLKKCRTDKQPPIFKQLATQSQPTHHPPPPALAPMVQSNLASASPILSLMLSEPTTKQKQAYSGMKRRHAMIRLQNLHTPKLRFSESPFSEIHGLVNKSQLPLYHTQSQFSEILGLVNKSCLTPLFTRVAHCQTTSNLHILNSFEKLRSFYTKFILMIFFSSDSKGSQKCSKVLHYPKENRGNLSISIFRYSACTLMK